MGITFLVTLLPSNYFFSNATVSALYGVDPGGHAFLSGTSAARPARWVRRKVSEFLHLRSAKAIGLV